MKKGYIATIAALAMGCHLSYGEVPFVVNIAEETGRIETDKNGNQYPELALGEEIPDGSTILCTNFDTSQIGWMGEGCGEYLLRVSLSGLTDERVPVIARMEAAGVPTWEQYLKDGQEVWGEPGFCIFRLTCYSPGNGCFGQSSTDMGLWLKVPAKDNGTLTYEIHDRFYQARPIPYRAKFRMITYQVDPATGEEVAAHTFYVLFQDTENGINSISTSEESEYYTLTGMRVKNPTQGIYLRRTASETTKVIIR